MQMLYIWILAAVVFGVLEGITAQLVSIWFVLGAVAAAVAAACGGAVWPARSTDGAPIAAGTTVVVDRIEGVKLMVRTAKTPAGKV